MFQKCQMFNETRQGCLVGVLQAGCSRLTTKTFWSSAVSTPPPSPICNYVRAVVIDGQEERKKKKKKPCSGVFISFWKSSEKREAIMGGGGAEIMPLRELRKLPFSPLSTPSLFFFFLSFIPEQTEVGSSSPPTSFLLRELESPTQREKGKRWQEYV